MEHRNINTDLDIQLADFQREKYIAWRIRVLKLKLIWNLCM